MVAAARKRRKTVRTRADDSEDEELEEIPTLHSQANAPSSYSLWSTRTIASDHIAPLTSICISIFALNFREYWKEPSQVAATKQWLATLPDALIPRILAALRNICPTYLPHEFISTYLLRGPSLSLGDDLPAVGKNTILAISRLSSREHLRELRLKGLRVIEDEWMASVVKQLPSLQTLYLRECMKVSTKTAKAASHCTRLSVANFSFTAVPPVSLVPLLRDCHDLQVLKCAGISDWTDATLAKLFKELIASDNDPRQLANLKTLKLRQTSVTDLSVSMFLKICPNIRRLDLSFTGVRHPPLLLQNTALEKLSLTSTLVSSPDLLKIISGMTNLKTLVLGALGRGGGTAISVANTTAMTMTDATLGKLANILQGFQHLQNLNLAGNTKLGMVTRTPLSDFISKVGRKCKTLNLGGVSSLRSSDLMGLLADSPEEELSPLQVLVLNNTAADDSAAPYISSCTSLQVLELGSTKFTDIGLCTIIDACEKLEKLNLTSCRGVDVSHRRNFFEVYNERRRESQGERVLVAE